jgi:hypothetical protein
MRLLGAKCIAQAAVEAIRSGKFGYAALHATKT